jgi:hypothetical protein
MEKMPVLGSDSKLLAFVPMEILNEEWAQKNHGQSLSRLKERGGLCLSEIAAIIDKRNWTGIHQTNSLATINMAMMNLIVTIISQNKNSI